MANKKKAMLLGWVMDGKLPTDGESAKNQQILSRMRALGWDVIILDFRKWKRRPWIVLKTLACLALYPRTPLILSSSPLNIYRFIKLHRLLRSRRKVLHWAIGGTLGDKTRQGIFSPADLRSVTCHFVETPKMAADLALCGVDNVRVVPNFKVINHIPVKKPHQGPLRFVFVSRIMAEKGLDIIFDAVRALNARGLRDKFTVDIYGSVTDAYRQPFADNLASAPNVRHAGFLDFTTDAAYDTLATYDVMLFPTYWKGEGFAGIFIDAFVAQTPIIASDWAHNRSILADTGTAVIIPPHSPQALADAMLGCLDGSIDIAAMTARCRDIAGKYDSRTLITDDLLKIIAPPGNK